MSVVNARPPRRGARGVWAGLVLVCLLGGGKARGDDAAPATTSPPPAKIAALPEILAEVKRPGARAVLVNVWATWCDPCRDELPALLRAYRENRARGLRLVMVSADDADGAGEVNRVLAAAAAAAVTGGEPSLEFVSFIKKGDDTDFVNGLDRRWSGALPATFLFDGAGRRVHAWLAPVTAPELEKRLRDLLTAASGKPRTKPGTMSVSKQASTSTSTSTAPRRQP
ncbi:MAG: TlpA disulfide reductase family protein [Pseudomonadota bacterium]